MSDPHHPTRDTAPRPPRARKPWRTPTLIVMDAGEAEFSALGPLNDPGSSSRTRRS
jgi:hypothetical protein